MHHELSNNKSLDNIDNEMLNSAIEIKMTIELSEVDHIINLPKKLLFIANQWATKTLNIN